MGNFPTSRDKGKARTLAPNPPPSPPPAPEPEKGAPPLTKDDKK